MCITECNVAGRYLIEVSETEKWCNKTCPENYYVDI